MIRALIVDDEPAARRGIALMLADHPDFEVVGQCADGLEALEAIEQVAPDLVFLDIQMPGLDGFDVLQRLGAEAAPGIIFVTAYDEYAIRAFDVNAIDYLLKPYSDSRFAEALERARGLIERERLTDFRRRLASLLGDLTEEGASAGDRDGGAGPAGQVGRERTRAVSRFPIKTRGRVVFVSADEVSWISAERDYVRLHTGQRSYLLREKIGELEEQLSPEGFVRVHRSALVRVEAIDELQDLGDGRYLVRLADGRELRMSRSGAARLQAALGRTF
jgi:two-component system LytT family response regulator